ncbi:sugar (pentulose or hexulose) kinase [Prauserella sediminis]|uniref:Sugar (Pentulose or hexulose) kinase n=1 Tax=Prauserella sediminis TaxID=577680 RepID=A0A839XR25_9PSEU|nr:FGGY-family carbohydrate kinase [Prauserella sediminis]MBB3665157.1 sugar (pentulose or hexulose) kinase [Prauserella sediminis]
MSQPPVAVVGIDAGTTAVKATVLTTDGAELATARAPVHVARPGPAQAEQSMTELWHAVVRTVREALETAGDVDVAAAGVTGQGDGAWLLDEHAEPVGPAILWLDGRAADRVRAWEHDGKAAAVRRTTGSTLFPGALPVLLEELEATRPELLRRARHHANCKDWIRSQLTGVLTTDASEASRTYVDTATGTYSDELIDALGHRRFAELLPPIEAAGSHRPLTAAAADTLGLPAGIPVVTGLVDTAAGGAGLGVSDPGQSYAIIGTTAFLGTVHATRADVGTDVGITLATGQDGAVLECLCPMSGTPNLDWVRDLLGRGGQSWEAVEAEARAVSAGAGGVLYLPYGAEAGERAPFADPHASASWLGLSTETTPGQLLRAVYEGIAFSLRECQEALGVGGTLRLCGGAATSGLLCQILADITGCTIERASAAELGARGVAAHALAAITGTEVQAAAARLLGELDVFRPDPGLRTAYETRFAAFVAVRDAIRPHWPDLRGLRTLGDDPSSPASTSAGDEHPSPTHKELA